jgi:hypothetical protein
VNLFLVPTSHQSQCATKLQGVMQWMYKVIITKRVRGRRVTDLYLAYFMKFISPSTDLTECISEQQKIKIEKNVQWERNRR